jgi:hypothetical protein
MKHVMFAIPILLLSSAAAIGQAPPQAALDSCLKHAAAYNGVAVTAVSFGGSAEADVPWFGGGAGDNWRLRIDSEGNVAVSCTVSADGKRVALEPIG